MKNKTRHHIATWNTLVLIITVLIITYIGQIYKAHADSEKTLPIPPILEKNRKGIFKINIQKGLTEYVKGNPVITYGYNGNQLGPTIRASNNDKIHIIVKNKLREYTSVHWHGLLVPGEVDGGPHQVIQPDREWEVKFKISQQAATCWYHPHGLGNTAIQVYRGLAGLFIIDDKISKNLTIPSDYGINDIPLIIQDKRLTKEGVPLYISSMRDIMEGMKGNTVLVNGALHPILKVTSSLYRFRILNGSNARTYILALSSDDSFYQIATDAGFIEKPISLRSLRLSPGERAEILIDFSKYKKNKILYLTGAGFDILKIKITGKKGKMYSLPQTLVRIKRIFPSLASRSRIFELSGIGHHVAINRKQMNINRIDEYIKRNTIETWLITSSTSGMGMMHGRSDIFHNFHAHGIHFLILKRNGRPPEKWERGWKDTVFLNENEEVKVITKFLHKGIFMYHCHILEHEDNGMMGQFKVE